MGPKKLAFIAFCLTCLFNLLLFVFTLVLLIGSGKYYSLETRLYSYPFILNASFISLGLSWISFRLPLTVATLILFLLMSFLIFLNTSAWSFLYYCFYYLIAWGIGYWYYRQTLSQKVAAKLQSEKQEESINKLNDELKHLLSKTEVEFNRYSNFFKLREVAEKFATSLHLNTITKLIVQETMHIMRKGDLCLLYLTDIQEQQLSLVSVQASNLKDTSFSKTGSVFDQWILKSRQHLLVTDTVKDIRFDYSEPNPSRPIRSLIAAPLISEGRVIGTLRLNAFTEDCFSTDDLRLLNILAVLGSSAVWNALLYKQTEDLAIRDSLTNLYVQRYFKQRIKEEHRRSLITNTPLSLLMCDLDHFKRYNDQYGHAAGDIVLKKIADLLNQTFEKEGLVARYGGEEFAILLPNLSKSDAIAMAKKLCQDVAALVIQLRDTTTSVTISIGVANQPEDTLDFESLILKADRNLYDAKKHGRNRVYFNETV